MSGGIDFTEDSKIQLHSGHISVKVKQPSPYWWNQWKCHCKRNLFKFIHFHCFLSIQNA